MDSSGVKGHSGDGNPEYIAERTAVSAIAGGTASVLSGGKFANGAITGAFAQLYNAEGGGNYAEKYWNEVQLGIEKVGQSIGGAVQSVYRAIVPGYAAAECALYGGCTGGDVAIAGMSLVPFAAGGPTAGILKTATGQIRLISGARGFAAIEAGTPGFNAITRTHVEGHAAAYMRQNAIDDAVLTINNPEICVNCMRNLPHMLPEGAKLTVQTPNSSHVFIGNGR